MPDPEVLDRLEAEGLILRGPEGVRTTRRWQAAMARAAFRLYSEGAPWSGLRLPMASALVELRPDLADEELVRWIEALLPLEQQAVFSQVGEEA